MSLGTWKFFRPNPKEDHIALEVRRRFFLILKELEPDAIEFLYEFVAPVFLVFYSRLQHEFRNDPIRSLPVDDAIGALIGDNAPPFILAGEKLTELQKLKASAAQIEAEYQRLTVWSENTQPELRYWVEEWARRFNLSYDFVMQGVLDICQYWYYEPKSAKKREISGLNETLPFAIAGRKVGKGPFNLDMAIYELTQDTFRPELFDLSFSFRSWDPCQESWGEYNDQVDTAFKEFKRQYKASTIAAFEQAGFREVPAPRDLDQNLRWLIIRVVLETPYPAIADKANEEAIKTGAGKTNLDEGDVRKAVHRAAGLMGIKLEGRTGISSS